MGVEGVRDIQLKDAARWFRSRQFRQIAKRGLYSAALRGVQKIQTFIIPSRSPQPVDRGLFRAGWRAVQTKDGAAIENSEPHAVFIEYGVQNVKTGKAMLAAIAEWAIRKGLATELNAKSRAYAIALSMKRRGMIFGQGGMRILEEAMTDYIPNYITEEIEHEMIKAWKQP